MEYRIIKKTEKLPKQFDVSDYWREIDAHSSDQEWYVVQYKRETYIKTYFFGLFSRRIVDTWHDVWYNARNIISWPWGAHVAGSERLPKYFKIELSMGATWDTDNDHYLIPRYDIAMEILRRVKAHFAKVDKDTGVSVVHFETTNPNSSETATSLADQFDEICEKDN